MTENFPKLMSDLSLWTSEDTKQDKCQNIKPQKVKKQIQQYIGISQSNSENKINKLTEARGSTPYLQRSKDKNNM